MEDFVYIPIIAAICYCFMLLIFLAAKKNKLVNSFLLTIASFLIWTVGSLLMRQQVYPGYQIWYHVSLYGLLLLPFAYYRLVAAFADSKSKCIPSNIYLVLITVLFAVNVRTGMFLQYPHIEQGLGSDLFVYDYTWKVVFLFGFTALLVVLLFINVIKACKVQRNLAKQLQPVLVGVIVLFLGNVMITVPFLKGFPADILGGLINAIILFYCMIKRHLFQLQLLSSRWMNYSVGVPFAIILFFMMNAKVVNFIDEAFDAELYGYLIYAVMFLAVYLFFTFMWNVVVKNVFIKEEIQQREKISEFSSKVAQLLEMKSVLGETVSVIKETTEARSVYICMQNGAGSDYRAVFSDGPLNDLSFAITEHHPIVSWLMGHDTAMSYSEFKHSVEYRSMWEIEKQQMEKMAVDYCVGIKDGDELAAIVLVSGNEKHHRFTFNEIQTLESIASVSSLAIKNTQMYEQVYREARTDEMTGLLNRKYFYEALDYEFQETKDGTLSLIMFNVDDFKLFNQLYGEEEGDQCLKKVAHIIKSTVGENGYCARYGGKEFVVLLPNYDIYTSRLMSESIVRQVYEMHDGQENKMKSITMSVGISVAPYAAKTAKELMDNVDMAVYSVKHSGKNGIKVFDQTFGNTIKKDGLEQHLDAYKELESTIYALTAAIDAKDHYTFNHSNNVAYYATALARQLNLNEDVVEIIRQAALLHDVGKISIAEPVLNKTGRLTDEEYSIMKGHVEASIGIIRHLPSLDYVIPAVIGHHERFDGKGYPRRIAGTDIPLTARILCIADSFDAMTSKRCYKEAFPMERARAILLEEVGKQFDPDLVPVFVECLDNGTIKIVE